MGVHENILRLVVEGDDGDDRTVDTMESGRVRMHVEWLKQSYLRLQGWDKSAATYKNLVNAILDMVEHRHKPEWQGVRGTDHWDKKETASDSVGQFIVPKEWEFEDRETAGKKDNEAKETAAYKRSGMGMKRATSNWGMHHLLPFLNGDHGEHHRHGNGVEADGHGSAATESKMFVRGADGVCT